MNENTIHGAPKTSREWRIALSNHYAWFQNQLERGDTQFRWGPMGLISTMKFLGIQIHLPLGMLNLLT